MTPIEYYEFACQENKKVEDAEQRSVLAKLQVIYDALLQSVSTPGWQQWFRKITPVQGLYIYGGVGIGKTFLMDCFYNALPFKEKRRQDFHVFMRFVHQALKQHAGIKNPLDKIAEEMSRETRVLCFDEFVVTDITDAMLFRHLLSALFSRGVCVVATSNVAPDDLYKRGLQRDQFIPAIELIKKFTEVVHLPSKIDYRLRHLKQAGVFYTPNDAHAEHQMEKTFFVITAGHEIYVEPINTCDRLIPVKKSAGDIVWFDFNAICHVGRSQQDYLAIAERYSTVFLSNIPVISSESKDTISLLIKMVEVFYDAHIRLVCSAEAPIDCLYLEGNQLFEFQRTKSRLLEMQSEAYFSQVT